MVVAGRGEANGLPVVVAVVPGMRVGPRVVGTVGTMGSALGLGDSGEVSGLGVLHFRCLDGDSVVDDRDVVGAGMVGWCVVGRGVVSLFVVG